MKPKVIILGGNYASLLGMIRATGIIGCDITVIKTFIKKKKKGIEYCSKYVNRYFFVKDADRAGLVDLLLTKCVDYNQKVILIPTNDDTTMTIDLHQDILKKHFICPTINNIPGAITQLMNKSKQKEIANKVGLNTPKGTLVTLKDGKYKIEDEIIYPCFTKAEVSVYGGKTFMKKCNNESELIKTLDIASKRWDCNVLIEEYINIEKEFAVVGCSFGNIVYIPGVIYLELQGDGDHKGVAMTGKIEPIEKHIDIINLITEFIKEIKYEGLFDVDFYFSKGKYYFNELNLRCGASCFAFTYKGINIPEKIINYYTSKANNYPTVDYEFAFVNEKVCLESYTSNYISWNKYKEIIKSKGVHSIENSNDINPGITFNRLLIKHRVKKFAKHVLNVFGMYTFK